MRNLVVGTFLSLDGVMQGPGGPEEDRSGGFDKGGWLVPLFDDMMGQFMDESLGRADGLILGRKTYEIFAAHWPHVGKDDPMGAKLNSVQKYVASRTLNRVEWKNSTLIKGDVVEKIRALKNERGGDLHIAGSGDLIQTLLKHNLIDEFHLLIFPVLLGKGKRLFAEGTLPAKLEVVETRTSTTGVMIQIYKAAGRLETASAMLDPPTPAEVERRQKVANE